MSEPAISVTGLGKCYRLGEAPRADSLREVLSGAFSRATLARAAARAGAAARALTRGGERDDDPGILWSLRDVSFDVRPGDALGIIGRNGAGKSTLLKILSRITQPTTGRVRIVGRVGSLLEVGTGFHPELSGRENIFLNGAILGMSRAEIARKFDEIVAFAEVERFLDTQVKHYSSGMYLRLAFAVAAHLEPDILLVDEVLAVGDLEFQRKCIGKMGSVAGEGRTVLFVSHNMAAVRTLCRSAMVLDAGRVVREGDPGECVAFYVARGFSEDASTWMRPDEVPEVALTIARVDGRLSGHQPDLSLELDIFTDARAPHRPAMVAVDILDAAGVALMQALPSTEGFIRHAAMRQRTRVTIALPPLIPGQYFATVWVGPHFSETLDVVERAIRFEVHDTPSPGRSHQHSMDHGHIVPKSTAVCEVA